MRPGIVIALGMLVVPAWLAAQRTGGGTDSGTLNDRVEYTYVYSSHRGSTQERHHIDAIALFRGQTGWRQRELRHTATEATLRAHGLSYSQRLQYLHAPEQRGDTIYVLGRAFVVPPGDSTLVVMVDRVDSVGGAPQMLAAVRLGAEVSSSYWPKMWHSGDTTFIVAPPRDRNELLASALRTDSIVRRFIEP